MRSTLREILRLLLTSEPSRAKQILTMTLSVLVAILLWVIVTLNQPYSPTYEIPVKIGGVPDSLHLTHQGVDRISVKVSGLGVDLMRGHWSLRGDTLELPYAKLIQPSGYLREAEFKKRLEGIFSENVDIGQVTPGRVEVAVEPEVKKVVPVRFDADLKLEPTYQLSRSPHLEDLEVTLYGPSTLLDSVSEWQTVSDYQVQIDSQSVIQVPLRQPPPGLSIDPKVITLPVYPRKYTETELSLPVQITGMPEGLDVRLSRNHFMVSCLLPVEAYEELLALMENYTLKVPFDQLDPAVPYLIPTLNLPAEIKPISRKPQYLSFVIVNRAEEEKF